MIVMPISDNMWERPLKFKENRTWAHSWRRMISPGHARRLAPFKRFDFQTG